MGHEKEIQENGEIAAIEHMMMEFMKTRDAIINKIDTLKPLTTKEKISRAFAVLDNDLGLDHAKNAIL